VDALSELLNLRDDEKARRGLAHTPAEIAQQPEKWLTTFASFRRRLHEIAGFLSSAGLGAASQPKPTVFLVGAGTSDYIGHALSFLLRKQWQCEVLVVPSTDLVTHVDEFLVPPRKTLWIWFSRSGDTPEGVAALEQVRKKCPDAWHLVISCNTNGRMVRESADQPRTLTIPLENAVNDRGLAMTSSFSSMVVLGQCLGSAGNLGGYEETLARLVQAGKSFLPSAANLAASLAQGPYTKACFLGSGTLRAAATESALKLVELTAGRTLAFSESPLGLRHGPMAALDQNTLVVSFLSGDLQVQRYELDLLEEIGSKKLVTTRVIVGARKIPDGAAFTEHQLAPSVPLDVADDYRSVVDVMFGQLLGLFFSLRWELRPDCPSPNGAISRVVQNVSIYA